MEDGILGKVLKIEHCRLKPLWMDVMQPVVMMEIEFEYRQKSILITNFSVINF